MKPVRRSYRNKLLRRRAATVRRIAKLRRVLSRLVDLFAGEVASMSEPKLKVGALMFEDPKFKVGQVLMYDRAKKRGIPVKVLQIVNGEHGFFYRIDRKNCVAEHMVRELTPEEKGK